MDDLNLHSVIICLSKMVSLYVTLCHHVQSTHFPFRKQPWLGNPLEKWRSVHGKIIYKWGMNCP